LAQMEKLLKKLNYKGQKRIALINGSKDFVDSVSGTIPDVQIDPEIDPRYPYEFILLFVQQVEEIENLAPRALHNLVCDGILWFAFPKKSSRNFDSDIDRDHGWEVLIDRGFDRVRQVVIDDNWSALRFRNARYIRSSGSGT
jgi:hypothetical protein